MYSKCQNATDKLSINKSQDGGGGAAPPGEEEEARCTEMGFTWEARKATRTRAPNSIISNRSERNSERRAALASSAHNAGVQVALRRVKPRSLEPTSFHTTSAASRAEALDRGARSATNSFPGADILLHARSLPRTYKRGGFNVRSTAKECPVC